MTLIAMLITKIGNNEKLPGPWKCSKHLISISLFDPHKDPVKYDNFHL